MLPEAAAVAASGLSGSDTAGWVPGRGTVRLRKM
jgi:hypothetical protein